MGWMGVLIDFTDFTHMTLLTDMERFNGIYLQKTLPDNPCATTFHCLVALLFDCDFFPKFCFVFGFVFEILTSVNLRGKER